MADIQYYERILKKKEPKKKAMMIAIYLGIVSAWFVIAVRYTLNAAILLMIPLSVIIAVLLSWKYTQVEYEYSFAAGSFTFSKIYGRSKRKTVFSADIKSMVLAKPYEATKDQNRDSDDFIIAIPESTAKNPCICIFDNDDKKICVLIDCDEMSAKILKFFNASATDRDGLKNAVTQTQWENENV